MNDQIGQKKMRYATLASGSSGNVTYVETETTKILIDAGMSLKYIRESLAKIGRDVADIDAVVISHEHRDHICGLGPLTRKIGMPVYVNKPTYEEIVSKIGEIENIKTPDSDFEIRDIQVDTFRVDHDAIKPRMFTLSNRKDKLGVVTDLGIPSPKAEKTLKTCQSLVLESNHDPEMLTNGPYPWPLKKRVGGDEGHLSNFQATNLLTEHARDQLKHVTLAHLSRTNNSPEVAYNTCTATLQHRPDLKTTVDVAAPFEPLKIREVN